MLCIGPDSRSFSLSIILSAFLVLLLPSAAQAACSRWDISGKWTAVQSNDTKPSFTLQQTDTQIQGSAHWGYTVSYNTFPAKGDDYVESNASVDGTINGDSVEFTAYWSNDTIGVYSGKIGPQGRIEGTTYDRRHPQTNANWYSDRTVRCLSGEDDTSPSSTTPPVDDKPPPVALGRVHTAPAPPLERMGNEPPICANARSARARNSPSASALESQCRAAGGNFTDRAVMQAPSDIRARNTAVMSHAGITALPADAHAPPPAAAQPAEAPRLPGDRPMLGESFTPPLFDDGAQLWACVDAAPDAARRGACNGMKAARMFCRAKGHSGALQQHRDGTPALTTGPTQDDVPARSVNGDVCTTNNCIVITELDCAP
jgi:hypothetical protein